MDSQTFVKKERRIFIKKDISGFTNLKNEKDDG
jgi:hypothetical protein